jgi:hypothetical protein
MVHVWHVPSRKALFTDLTCRGDIRAVALSPNGRFLTFAAHDPSLAIWNLSTGDQVWSQRNKAGNIRDQAVPIEALAFSPNSDRVCAASDCLCLYAAASGKLMAKVADEDNPIFAATYSPNGLYFANGNLSNVSVRTGRKLAFFREQGFFLGIVSCLAFSADSRLLASGSRGNERVEQGYIELWRMSNGKLIKRWLAYPESQIGALSFAPNGQILASLSRSLGNRGGSVNLWSVATTKELPWSGLCQTRIDAIAFAPDGRTLLAAREDGTILCCDVATGTMRCQLVGHRGPVRFVGFLNDSYHVVSLGQDATILQWNMRALGSGTKPRTPAVTKPDLAELWQDLGYRDASVGFRATVALQSSGQLGIDLLKSHLELKPGLPDARANQLIADLASDEFKRRQASYNELQKLREIAEQHLLRASTNAGSADQAKQIKRLLDRLSYPIDSIGKLRLLRAIEVLEYIATDQAYESLKSLTKGPPASIVTQEAQSALRRLARKRAAL